MRSEASGAQGRSQGDKGGDAASFQAEAAAVLAGHKGVEVWFVLASRERAHLEAIWSHRERRSGAAGQALRALFRVADRHGVAFTLTPRWLAYELETCEDTREADRLHALNEQRLGNEALQDWYARMGFTPTGSLDGDHPVMERRPRTGAG